MKHFSIKRIIYYFEFSCYSLCIIDINLQKVFIYSLFIASSYKKVAKNDLYYFLRNCNFSIRFFYTLSGKLIFLTFQKNLNCSILKKVFYFKR